MAQSTLVLHLDNISIRKLDGLFSLNDLHVAAGCEARHQPHDFLRIEQTKALIAELLNSGESRNYCRTAEGRNGGTYVCREPVIAYAAWINAAFHLKVLRAFLDNTRPGPAAAPPPPQHKSLPSERGARTMLLNPCELELIEMLRWTTYAGRDMVRETARIMRMRCPWVQGGDMDRNTARAKGVQVLVSIDLEI